VESDAQSDEQDAFQRNVTQNLFDIFWAPEIERRGGAAVVGPFVAGVAVLPPDQPPRVLLNDEAQIVAKSRADSALPPNEPLTQDNLDHLDRLEPVGVDPDHGWVLSAVLPDGRMYSAFDFRRNRGKGRRLLTLAEEYRATAEDALAAGRVGPCIESSFAAAELAIVAMMHLTPEAGRRKDSLHRARREWLDSFTQLGNAPRDFHDAVAALSRARGSSRYGESEIIISVEQAASLLAPVAALIDHAQGRVGVPATTPRKKPSNEGEQATTGGA